jgi:hypothetical protein
LIFGTKGLASKQQGNTSALTTFAMSALILQGWHHQHW